jgi:hypothetical protein
MAGWTFGSVHQAVNNNNWSFDDSSPEFSINLASSVVSIIPSTSGAQYYDDYGEDGLQQHPYFLLLQLSEDGDLVVTYNSGDVFVTFPPVPDPTNVTLSVSVYRFGFTEFEPANVLGVGYAGWFQIDPSDPGFWASPNQTVNAGDVLPPTYGYITIGAASPNSTPPVGWTVRSSGMFDILNVPNYDLTDSLGTDVAYAIELYAPLPPIEVVPDCCCCCQPVRLMSAM